MQLSDHNRGDYRFSAQASSPPDELILHMIQLNGIAACLSREYIEARRQAGQSAALVSQVLVTWGITVLLARSI